MVPATQNYNIVDFLKVVKSIRNYQVSYFLVYNTQIEYVMFYIDSHAV